MNSKILRLYAGDSVCVSAQFDQDCRRSVKQVFFIQKISRLYLLEQYFLMALIISR